MSIGFISTRLSWVFACGFRHFISVWFVKLLVLLRLGMVWPCWRLPWPIFLRAFLTPVLASAFPFVTYLVGITLVGWIGGGGPAALAVVLSAMAASYWFLPPAFSLFPHDAETLLGVAVFLVMCGMIAVTWGAMKRAQDRAEKQARLLEEIGTVL